MFHVNTSLLVLFSTTLKLYKTCKVQKNAKNYQQPSQRQKVETKGLDVKFANHEQQNKVLLGQDFIKCEQVAMQVKI